MSTDLSSPSTKSTTSYRPLTTYSRRSNRRSHPSQSTSNSVNDPTALSSNDSSPPSAMNPYDSEDNTISETERRLKKRAKHSQSQLHSQSVYVDVPTLSHSRSRELVAQRPSQSHARNATNGTNATSTFASGTLAGESAMTSSTTVDLEGSGHASKRFKIPSQPVSASTALSVSQPRTNKRHIPSNAAHISTSTANSPTNNTISSGLVSFPLMHRSTSYPAQDPPQDIDFSQFKTPANAESLSPVQPPPIDPNRGRNRDGIAHARPRNKQRDLEGRDPLSGSQSRHGGGGRRSGSAGAGRDTKAFSPVPVPRVRQKDVNVNRNRQQNAPDGTASGQFKAPALPQSKPQSQPQSRSQSKSRRISSRKLKENATAATTTATSTSFRCGQGQGQILGEGLSRSGRATPALGFPLASPYQTKPSSPTQPSLAPAPVRKSLGSPGEIIGLGGGSGVGGGGGGGGGDEASIVRNRGSGKKKPAFYTKTRTMSDAKVYDEQLRADRDQDGFVLPVGRAHPQRPRASRNGTGVGDGSGVGEGGSRGGGSFGAAALREYAYSQSVIHSPTRRDKDLPLQYEGPGITLKSSRFKSNGKPPATRFPSNRNVHDQPPHSKTSHRPHPGQMQEEGLPASAPGPVSGMLDLSQISSEQWHKPAKVFSLAKSQSQSHSLSLSRRRGSCDEEINLDELLYPPNETPPVFEVGYGYGGDFGYGHGYGYGLQDDGDGEYEVPQVSERSLGSREASMHLEGDEEAEFGGAMRYKAGWLNLEPDEEEAGKGGVDDEDGEESMDLTLQALDSIRRPSGSRSRSQDEVGLGLGFSLDPGADVEMGAGTGWLMGSAFGTGNTLEVGDEGERSMSMEGTSFRGPPSTPPRSTRSSSFFADVPMGTSTPFRRKQRELMERSREEGGLRGAGGGKGKKREEVMPSAPNTPDRMVAGSGGESMGIEMEDEEDEPMTLDSLFDSGVPTTWKGFKLGREDERGERKKKTKKVMHYTPNSIFSSSFVDATEATEYATARRGQGGAASGWPPETLRRGLGSGFELGKDSLFDDYEDEENEDEEEEDEEEDLSGKMRKVSVSNRTDRAPPDRTHSLPIPIPSGLAAPFPIGATTTTPPSQVSKRSQAQDDLGGRSRKPVGRNRAGTIKASDYDFRSASAPNQQNMKFSVSVGGGALAGDDETEDEEGRRDYVSPATKVPGGRARSGTIRASAVNPGRGGSAGPGGGRARSGTIRASSFSAGTGNRPPVPQMPAVALMDTGGGGEVEAGIAPEEQEMVMNMDMDMDMEPDVFANMTTAGAGKDSGASLQREMEMDTARVGSSSPDPIDFLRLRGGHSSGEDDMDMDDDPAFAVIPVADLDEDERKELRRKRTWSRKIPFKVRRRLIVIESMNIGVGNLEGDELLLDDRGGMSN